MNSFVNEKHALFINWMSPFIDILKAKGGSATPKEVREGIAKKMKLSDDFLSERYEKSGQLRFDNQVYWAKQYLAWENLVITSKRGIWALTDEGWESTLSYDKSLEVFNKWVKIHANARKKKEETNATINEVVTDEVVDTIEKEIESDKTLSLLEILKSTTPRGFEQLCGRLLREYDFEAIEVTKGSHDKC